MAYKKKQTVNRQSEDVYRQKSYFHFRFNTNSGGIFPMQSIFYLKPQGYQIWAYNYPKICRFLLTFSILQYLIGFIFYPTMQESIFCLRTTFPYVLFDWYPCLVVIHHNRLYRLIRVISVIRITAKNVLLLLMFYIASENLVS